MGILSSCSNTVDTNINNLESVDDSKIDKGTTDNKSKIKDNPVNEDFIIDVNYSEMEASYGVLQDAKKLTKTASVVVIGKVTDISFQVLDITTALPPTEKTEDRNRWLHTIYDVDVITSYKGKKTDNIKIRVNGGIKDYRVNEQLDLIKEMKAWPNDAILLQEKMPEIELRETYLFTLYESEFGGGPTNLHPRQTVYDINNPFEKQTLGRELKGEASDYYSQNTDEQGDPIISAKDVISAFGEDKWNTFWADWQKDNPNWETRLDKSAVEKALAN